jgi:hypothetical protein
MFDDGEGCVEPALYAKGKWVGMNYNEFTHDLLIPVLVEPKAKYKHEDSGPGSIDDNDDEEVE